VTRRLSILALALASVALTACGTKSEDTSGPTGTERLSLMLDFFPNADHAGIYEALAVGEFRRAGLDVDVQVPGDPSAPL
jgi:putative hydroxymethylpyrimidine transport system substrate-binding protein